MEKHADVMVLGDGILGLSIAFALADSPQRPHVALIARPGPAASRAAGAMRGVLGEITANSTRTDNALNRVRMAIEAERRWGQWRARVHARAGTNTVDDGFGSGTFLLLNGVSSHLDDENFAAIESFSEQEHIPAERVSPGDIPGYLPFAGDRAHKALYLPEEGFLDARRWLENLQTALAAMPNVTVHRVEHVQGLPGDTKFTVQAGEQRIVADQAVVAAGVWTSGVVAGLRPGITLMPVISGAGAALQVRPPAPMQAVVRTPNRSFACGLHTVPMTDGTVYLGGTNNVCLVPEDAPTLSNVHYLSDTMTSQFHEGFITAAVTQVHFGNRPISLDTYPLLGATSAAGLWVATGTYREGLHTSPLIAQEIAADMLGQAPSGLPKAYAPERDPIIEWDRPAAVAEAARHVHSLAVETRMRPPTNGAWPAWLRDMYSQAMNRCYAYVPDDFVLHPELAPLAYESGPALMTMVQNYLTARSKAGAVTT